MKNLIYILALSISANCFASAQNILDALVGTYTSDDLNKSTVIVKKVLTSQGTLIRPAQYEYQVIVKSDKHDLLSIGGASERIRTLRVGEDQKSLALWMEKGCDDSGCLFFEEMEVIVEYFNGSPYIVITSYGWEVQYEVDEETRFHSKYYFSKK